MGYSWIAITGSTFDRSIPIKKVRWHMNNIPAGTGRFGVTEGCFSESPNINTDGTYCGTLDQPTYGYPRYHKFNMVYDGGKYVNSWNHQSTDEISIKSLPEVESGVYELDVTDSGILYWSGIENATDSPIYNNGNLVYVYAEVVVFEPSKSIFQFGTTGGTDTFELEANNNWTATTSSDWCSVSPSTGSTGGTITVNCNRNYTTSARTATVTFTDADANTFDITVNQKRGTTEKEVNKMYRSGELIYQRQMFTTRLSIGVNSLSFDKTGATQNVSVRSNAPYTYSASTDWITISTASTGIAVTLPNYTGTTERTGTITITTNNAGDIVTKTISVTQKVVNYVSYIHIQNITTENTSAINTGIYPTTATTFRVVGMGKGYAASGKVVGFDSNDAGSDYRDYRLFWTTDVARLLFDWNSDRLWGIGWTGYTDGNIIDLTADNFGVKETGSATYIITGTPQTTMATTTVPIYVNVGSWWLKKLQIWQGETLVFDGEAAIDNGHIGLWDRVSDQLIYNPDLTMGYEE